MRNSLHRWLACGVATMILASVAAAADSPDGSLRKRFEERYPHLLKLKVSGHIGETWEGYVEVVKDADAAARQLLADENADRRQLYELIARREGTTAQKVAERNAVRNFSRARPGEWLKERDGWRKKT